jgi:hypothetical protein
MSAFAMPVGLFDTPRVPVVVAGKLSGVRTGIARVSYTVRDSSGHDVMSGTLRVAADGTFWGIIMVEVPGGKKARPATTDTVVVSVRDAAGNVATASASIVIPGVQPPMPGPRNAH